MHRNENLLFPNYIPSCTGDLNNIIKRLEYDFDEKFNKPFTHNRKKKDVKRRYIPNCIAANKLTMAILEYAYHNLPNNKSDEEIIRICRNRINEFDKNSIPKIITSLRINKMELYLIIENELKRILDLHLII